VFPPGLYLAGALSLLPPIIRGSSPDFSKITERKISRQPNCFNRQHTQ
jgi:hypothetical protein